MTEEEIKKSVLSAYDSVNLINELELLEQPEQADIDTIERNKKHITIMLEIEWFSSALTIEQLDELTLYKY
jgi:hypothetical protein